MDFVGSETWIRTKIHCSRGSSPTIRRSRNGVELWPDSIEHVQAGQAKQRSIYWLNRAQIGYTGGTSMRCAFCELPEMKARTILETDLAWVFPSYFPIAPAHLLVCPKRCIATYEELTTEEREALFSLMTAIKPALRSAYRAEGFNYAWNEGRIADQTVPHVHIHLLPRIPGDKEKLGFDPRATFYTNEPGTLTEEQIHVIRDEIKRCL